MNHDGAKQRMRRIRSSSSLNVIPGLIAASVVLAGRLPLAASAAAVEAEDVATPSSSLVTDAGNNRVGRNLRRRRLNGSIGPNTCIEGTSLHPGDTLSRGEFLCHGKLRFGIDAAFGRFILGFAEPSSHSNSSNINNNTDTVTPVTIVWTAVPTTLFMEKTRPFQLLTLSSDGNLFGYDENEEEVYDSNYDYYNRLHSKADDSILSLSKDCGNATTMIDGAMCVHLTSPQVPGMPHGEVTWGVEIRVADLVALDPPPGSGLGPQPIAGPGPDHHVPAPVPAPGETFPQLGGSPPPPTMAHPRTSRPTRNLTKRPTPAPTRDAVVRSPTLSPSYHQNLFGQDETIIGLVPTSIIWGKAWLDANHNGLVDPLEENLERLEVTLFECSGASAGQVVQSMTTDGQGMYFFQVRTGKPFKVHFVVPNPDLRFSSGGDTDADMEGWTACEDSRNDQPIQWNVGIFNGTAASHTESHEMPDIGLLPSNTIPAEGFPVADADPLPGQTGQQLEEDAIMTGPTSSPVAKPVMSSIGGFIYLDVDESGTMEAKEHAAAVGGYTVSDAVIVVSLTDCESNTVMDSIDVEFPGTYAFENLTEGYYKLGYEMVVLARSEAAPLYSFVDNGSADRYASTLYETQCGKVGKGEIIEDGNVGLRMAPLNIMSKGPVGGPVGPDQVNLDEMEAMSPVGDEGKERLTASAEGEEAATEEGGGTSSFVPTLVGVIVTLSVLVALSIVFVKHRGGDMNDAFPFLGSTKRTEDRADVRSVGSSIGGDAHAAPRADRTAIGSLVVEASKSVAALTAVGGESSSDDDDGSSSDQGSYTGMEFALKGPASAGGSDNGARGISPATSESHSHVEEIREEGSEGYEVYDDEEDEEKNGHGDYGPVISDMIAKYSQKAHGGSDEELPPTATAERNDREERGDGSPIRYHHQGAQDDQEPQNYSQDNDPSQDYSQQQYSQDLGQGLGHDHYHAQSEYTQDPGLQENNQDHYHVSAYNNQDQTQNYSQQQYHQQVDEQENNPDYYKYLQNQPHYQEDMANVQNGANHEEGSAEQQPFRQYESDYQNHRGYYSNDGAYDMAAPQQHQYHYGGVQPQPQYDEQTSISGSSRSSSDPPAASYRDIQHPPLNSGAMVGWGDPDIPQTAVDHHQYLVSDHQYAPNAEYAGADAAYSDDMYAADNYESNNQYVDNSDQYMAGDDGAYPNHYVVNNNDNNEAAYATTDYDNSYPHNYDENPQNDGGHHQQIDSDSSDSDSDSSSSSSEEASSSGWSSSSSTANSSAVSASSKWSSYSSSSNSKKMRARRAQSNPRDDRRGWRHHQAAIPENSTVEYNAYTMSNDGVEAIASEDDGHGGGRFASPAPIGLASDDNKSVHSSGSDQSSDPPGASYKNLHLFPPPPPRRTTPPRRNLSPNPKTAASTQRARSVPPPPPPRR